LVGFSDFLRNLRYGSYFREGFLKFQKKALRFVDCEAPICDYPSGVFYSSCSFTNDRITSAKISYLPQEQVHYDEGRKKERFLGLNESLLGHVDILGTFSLWTNVGNRFFSASSMRRIMKRRQGGLFDDSVNRKH